MAFKKIKKYLVILIIVILFISIFYFINLYMHNNKHLSFELNSKDKYEIITDTRWLTMLNDGGSNTSISYYIDLNSNLVIKVIEDYHANLDGKSKPSKDIKYQKKITKSVKEKLEILLEEIINDKSVSDITDNFNFYEIKSQDLNILVYNNDVILKLKDILKKIDAL